MANWSDFMQIEAAVILDKMIVIITGKMVIEGATLANYTPHGQYGALKSAIDLTNAIVNFNLNGHYGFVRVFSYNWAKDFNFGIIFHFGSEVDPLDSS
jgi:hypothetical protein